MHFIKLIRGCIVIVTVIGSRNFSNYQLFQSSLDKLSGITQIVTANGGMQICDFSEIYALQHHLPLVLLPSNWDELANNPSIVCNQLLIESADTLLIFWDGKCKACRSSIDFAVNEIERRRIFVDVVIS